MPTPVKALNKYIRFAFELRRFLRHPITLEEAKTIIRRRMEQREDNFLNLAERAIYQNPESPYLPLLKLAHCELQDLQRSVRSKGLEAALRELHQAGVYVTFEEFKGRKPIVRGGHAFHVRPEDFDNLHLLHYYQTESGGSTGQAVRISIDLDHLAAQAPYVMLTKSAHGLLDAPVSIWRGILPDSTGINGMLRNARFGSPPRRWFSPLMGRDLRRGPAWKYRLTTYAIVAWGRLSRVPLPWPQRVPLDRADVIARWAAQTAKAHGRCLIHTNPSKALRVCIAAEEASDNLTGTAFMGGGEPPTPAKVRRITRTGARYVPVYFISEIGAVGMGCARPSDENDLHFLRDSLALIPYPNPADDPTMQGLCLTTLLPTVPKLMLNVETDDFGMIERRACGCPLEEHGFAEHIRGLHSLSKLTGEGLTLVGSDMVRILEEVLPNRFGGSPLDYQLEEEEDGQGFTRLTLRVSPQVGPVNEAQMVKTVVAALLEGGGADDASRAILAQSRTLQIKRIEPRWSERGKLLTLLRHKK